MVLTIFSNFPPFNVSVLILRFCSLTCHAIVCYFHFAHSRFHYFYFFHSSIQYFYLPHSYLYCFHSVHSTFHYFNFFHSIVDCFNFPRSFLTIDFYRLPLGRIRSSVLQNKENLCDKSYRLKSGNSIDFCYKCISIHTGYKQYMLQTF